MQDYHRVGFQGSGFSQDAGRKSGRGCRGVPWREVENREGRRTAGRYLADVTTDWRWEDERGRRKTEVQVQEPWEWCSPAKKEVRARSPLLNPKHQRSSTWRGLRSFRIIEGFLAIQGTISLLKKLADYICGRASFRFTKVRHEVQRVFILLLITMSSNTCNA